MHGVAAKPTLPRLRRPALPEQPQEGRGPSSSTVAKSGNGSPRPAPVFVADTTVDQRAEVSPPAGGNLDGGCGFLSSI